MAQLIKLQDFISRYETDIFRYPSQYIRLKKERWEKIKSAWYNKEIIIDQSENINHDLKKYEPFIGFESFDENWLEDDNKGFFQTIKGWFKKTGNEDIEYNDLETSLKEATRLFGDEVKTEEDLKKEFLEELFYFQLNWASSTLRDRSIIDNSLYHDEVLKYFLQHFPDNYLLLYKPTLIVKKAPIDLDIILLSPVTTYCISLLESEDMSVYLTDRGRYWFEGSGENEKKRINPMISLNRTANLVQSYYKHYDIDLSVKKVVLSRTGYIEGDYEPVNTTIIDKRSYSDWYSRLRRLPSPIKFVQLKGAQALLRHCQSTYFRRTEWEPDEDEIQW
ncbi:NERD domain-containing protein [Calidifontibacillus oryziterrae]|uniref:NERD domain-containing protein n=1 Tax=Calidifontibacillus oryziterrae TaxID=1191699 RepID=UPI0002E4D5D9|nr:NERD domain-containing protein [Calidifontibacillus oryziterrae]